MNFLKLVNYPQLPKVQRKYAEDPMICNGMNLRNLLNRCDQGIECLQLLIALEKQLSKLMNLVESMVIHMTACT